LAVEPGDTSAQETVRGGLLLICQPLHLGKRGGFVYRDVNSVVANTSGAVLLAVAGDALPDLAEAAQLLLLCGSLRLDVDVDQVARCLALVALHRRLGLKVPQPTQPQAIESPRHAGAGSGQQLGDLAQVEPLMAELNGALLLMRIKRPPLGAANSPPIRKRSNTA
jgi:hypothetical protein